MKNSLVVIITPSRSQPRFHKRISNLKKFSDIVVFTFRRGLYEINDFQIGVQVFDLGLVKDREYIRRIFPFIRAIRIVKRNLPSRYKVIKFYTFSIDCLLIAKLAGIKKGFLEIGDLIFLNTANKWFRLIEKLILRFVNGLVLTSKEYYNKYYKFLLKHQDKPSVYIIENRVPSILLDNRIYGKSKKVFENRRYIIGLVGFLRFKTPIIRLLKFVNENTNLVSLKVFGDGPCKSLIKKHLSENITFFGSFKNPDDLPKIYNGIDINYVVYDATYLNEQIAIPNKLYESAFFQVPLVCSPHTYLSELTKKWGIGGIARIDTQNHFDFDMKKILNPKWINSAVKNCDVIPNSELLDHQENIIKTMLI